MKRNTNCEVSIKMLFTFHELTYSAGSHEPLTLCASVDQGEVLVVRGPSGAGKSTLLRILARLQAASRGTASLDGSSWLDIPSATWRAWVHYVAQKPALFEGSVAENLAKPFSIRVLSQNALNVEHARALMQALKLPASLWDQDARTLSGGEASRIAFARALLIEPKILLLDEPTAALDAAARTALYNVLADWLRHPCRAAVLVSHTDDYLELPGLRYLDLPTPADSGHSDAI